MGNMLDPSRIAIGRCRVGDGAVRSAHRGANCTVAEEWDMGPPVSLPPLKVEPHKRSRQTSSSTVGSPVMRPVLSPKMDFNQEAHRTALSIQATNGQPKDDISLQNRQHVKQSI